MPEFQAPPTGTYSSPNITIKIVERNRPTQGLCTIEVRLSPCPPDPAVNGGRQVKIWDVNSGTPIKFYYDEFVGGKLKAFKVTNIPCGLTLGCAVIDYIRLPDGHASGLRYYTLRTQCTRTIDCTRFTNALATPASHTPPADFPPNRTFFLERFGVLNGDITDSTGVVLLAASADGDRGPY